jgi:hypothetical protein
MPRARLQISMSPALETALRDLQSATGLAMGTFVSQIMEHNVGMIQGLTDAAMAAKDNPGKWILKMIEETMRHALLEQGVTPEEIASTKARPYTRSTPGGTDV